MRKFLAWNPLVYNLLNDALAFYLINTKTFSKLNLNRQIQSTLYKYGYSAYRIYPVFGNYDIVLRIWVTKGQEPALAHILRSEVEGLIDVETYTVSRFVHHWSWGRGIGFDSKSLGKINRKFVKSVQDVFDKPNNWNVIPVSIAITDGLLRIIEETDTNIIFFVSVELPGPIATLANATEFVINMLSKQEDIKNTAIYYIHGHADILVKGESLNLFIIGRFVMELNKQLAMLDARTTTTIVADWEIDGSEIISNRAFMQVEGVDLSVRKIFPALYTRDISDKNLKDRLEFWIKERIDLLDELPEKDLRSITGCLDAIVPDPTKDLDAEFEFRKEIGNIFTEAESKLRQPSLRFLANSVGQSKVQETIDKSLQHTKTRDEERIPARLSLGNRLHVLSTYIKQNNLSDDPDLIGIWNDSVELRNITTHGARELLPESTAHLSNVATFLKRFAKLMQFIAS